MTASVNTLIFRILLLTVALAPLPFGANRPWAWSLLAGVVAILAGGWALLVLWDSCRAPLPPRRLLAAGIPFAVALIWGILQASTFMPAMTWHPLWAEATQALGQSSAPGMISLAPEATWNAVMRLSCYAAAFLLAAQLATERARANEALVTIAAAGFAYALYGLIVYFSGFEQILWIRKWAYLGDLTSTFVNRNAYGAYAGIGLVCCIAMFSQKLRPRRNEQRGASEWTETLLIRAMPYLAAGVVIGSALLLSHSRGAFLATSLAILILLIALTLGRVLPPPISLRVGAAIVLIGVGGLALNGERTLERLFLETDIPTVDRERPEAYRLTLTAIADAPLTGHGLGAFQSAFRIYRDSTLPSAEDWQYAHNVFLETVMDLGIPAALALFGSFAAVVASCLRGLFRRRRDQVYPATAVAAVALLAVHGTIDFSAQMPAIALTLAVLLGVGFAQSWSSRQPSEQTGAA